MSTLNAERFPRMRSDLVLFAVFLLAALPACRNINTGAAEDFYARGDYGRAAEEYRQFIRDNPKEPMVAEAYLGLAWSEFQRGNLSEAGDAVEIFRSRYPAHRLAQTAAYLQGNIYFAERRFVEAEQELSALVREHPNDPIMPDARLLLARSAAAMLRYGPAADQYRIFLEKYGNGPYAPAALYGRAEALAKLARWDEAASALDELVRRFPDRPERPKAMLDLARYRIAASQYAAAENMLRGAIRDYSDSSLILEARRMLGNIFIAQAREDDAAAVYKSVYDTLDEASDSTAPEIAEWLAEYWARHGDTESARLYNARIVAAFERDPRRHARALAWMTLYQRERGDREEAMKSATRFLERYYEDARADMIERLLVDLLVEGGRVADGRDRLVTLIRKHYAEARSTDFYRAADLSMRLKDYAEALREVEEGLRRARLFGDTPTIKSGLYHSMILNDLDGKRTEAVANWWRLKQIDPDYVTVEEKVYWNAQEDRFYHDNRVLPAMRGASAFQPPTHQVVHVSGIGYDMADPEAHSLARSLGTLFVASITVNPDLDYAPRDKTRLVEDLVSRRDYAQLPDSYFPLRSTVGADWIITGVAHTEREGDNQPTTVVLQLRLLRVDYDGIFPFEYSYRIPQEEVTATAPGIVRETVERMRLYHPER